MEKKLFQFLDDHYEEMVEIRRHFHQNPELSFQEVETPAYIARYHENLGLDVKTGVGGRGVTATLKGGKPGPVVALRADFDALPIQDQKDVPYKSKIDGIMHACGHDGHTATLLVLAKALKQHEEELEGSVVFIHQHAEEQTPGGAIAMIEDGCLDGVDVVFGTHLWATDPLGTIQERSGNFMASTDRINIKVQGKGGHGAMPHMSRDAVVIGAQIVNNIQTIVSRRIDPLEPAVVTFGKFVADNANNVIADSVEIGGTIRTFNPEVREQIENELPEMVELTAKSAGGSAEASYERGYPAVVNHKEENDFLRKIAADVPGVENVETREPVMGGEDFAYYLEHQKGTFFFTGAASPERDTHYPHHHPMFDFDERAMVIAAKTLGKAVLDYR